MKVYVEPKFLGGKYTVGLAQGVQSFQLNYVGTKAECQWYAKMFRTALKKHDQELARRDKRKK